MPHKTVGILGGGQLGRMLSQSASLLGIPLLILDAGADTPAKQITPVPSSENTHVDGPYNSKDRILEISKKVDVLTIEIEHVDAEVLKQIELSGTGSCSIQPSPSTISLIQDKYTQHLYLSSPPYNLPCAPFRLLPGSNPRDMSQEDWENLEKELGMPVMLKSRRMAYDGKGNALLPDLDPSSISDALSRLGVPPASSSSPSSSSSSATQESPIYAESLVPFIKEVAVMVIRNVAGDVRAYDAVETIHKDSILRACLVPLRMDDWDGRSKSSASSSSSSTSSSGKHEKKEKKKEYDESVNERARKLAERAVGALEGAGVFGVEMFLLDDGELLINEIAPRPHNSGHHTIEACHSSQFDNHLRAILSLPLGSTALRVPSAGMLNLIGTSSDMAPIEKAVEVAMSVEGATVHLYGKEACRKGRKMGHITITGSSDATVREKMRIILRAMEDIDEEWINASIGSEPQPQRSHPQPLVGIIMGSDSDLPVMIAGARILDSFQIPYELTICSAHRTPQRMMDYARSAAGRGLKCIIAGAGGAAHLPGMVASETALPVVGVPVKASVLDGVDSLYSIVQMPRGIPCATVGINNSTNAALLAIRIIGSSDPVLLRKVEAYAHSLEVEVSGKIERLESIGWEEYVKGLTK